MHPRATKGTVYLIGVFLLATFVSSCGGCGDGDGIRALCAIAGLDGNQLVVGGQRGKILESVDGGSSFNQTKTPVNKDIFGLSVDVGYQIGVGRSRTILRRLDFGQSWNRVKDSRLSFVPELQGIMFDLYDVTYTLDSEEERVQLAVGGWGAVGRSTNAGRNWDFSQIGEGDHNGLRAIDCDGGPWCLAVGDNGGAYKSSDAGLSWSAVPVWDSDSNPFGGKLTDVYLGSYDSMEEAFAVGRRSVFRYTDGTTGLQEIFRFDKSDVKSLDSIAAGVDFVLVSGEKGSGENGSPVWRSDDGGDSFESIFIEFVAIRIKALLFESGFYFGVGLRESFIWSSDGFNFDGKRLWVNGDSGSDNFDEES